jgi:curved DNA-binding protein CbpA
MNPFEVLGVTPGAEQEAITGAYRALARKYHPDCNPTGAERMKAINAAYELLSDPGWRAAYDRHRPAEPRGGSRTSAPPPPPPPQPAAAIAETPRRQPKAANQRACKMSLLEDRSYLARHPRRTRCLVHTLG